LFLGNIGERLKVVGTSMREFFWGHTSYALPACGKDGGMVR
jgi:hypothetical protein